MAQVTNFFVGANSGDGFRNLFAEMIDLEQMQDFMILKGGPGVGKNTFMRSLGRYMEEAGLAVEYLWCSGDPDSLDGVVIPELRCAVADGTSPHVLEPAYPAAVDRYVNLGQFYDIAAAKAAADEVKAHTHAYQAAYVRAYHSLKAAREVEKDAVSAVRSAFDAEKARRRVEGTIGRELRRGSEAGRTTRRFLGSITHKGYIWRFDSVDALCPRVYELQDSFELAGDLLARIHAAATEKGWDTIVCAAPEEPARMEHLLIPTLGLAFVTSREGMEYGRKPYRRIRLDAMTDAAASKGRLRFQQRMVGLLRREAISALQEAKANHDALEGVYNPYVDFEGVHTLAALEAGRLLSYRR